jgi:hypothetical protein
MSTSIIWENPGLALLGVLAGIFLILLLPIVGAVRRSREERRADLLRAREPTIYGDRHYEERYHDERYHDDRYERPDHGNYFASQGDDYAASRRSAREARDDVPPGVFGSGPRRRKPRWISAPAGSVWFAIGVCVGAGGLALWWSLPPINPVTALTTLLDNPAPPTIAEQSPPTRDSKVQDRFDAPEVVAVPSAIGDGGDAGDELGEMVESFVANLRAQLPMGVGPGITMISVDSDSTSIAIGFAIAASVADEDAPKLQDELETRFRTSVCSTPPGPENIRGLNDLGVAFIINYVDVVGKNVAGLIVEPNFCSAPT